MRRALTWITLILFILGLYFIILGLFLSISNNDNEIDWKELGVVAPIQNQYKDDNKCPNSSWVFATVASIEGLMGVKSILTMAKQQNKIIPKQGKEYVNLIKEYSSNYKQESLSEQQLLDCTPQTDNCEGGSLIDGFEFALIYGIVDYQLVPYIGEKQICPRDKKSESVFNITNYQQTSGCDNLKKLIYQQPLAVRINYNNLDTFFTYDIDDDIITTKLCPQQSDYQKNKQNDQNKYQYVLITGFDGKSYTIKNSFGASWGYLGYAKIDATIDNVCNICDDIYYPTQDT